ncbi:energy transducer TonB [Flavobacterium sp. WC2509]|uniref:energy transducer TonB n=1 Tax=Flavobacterium sp. WC2509 TaxID=3461406 RepID=UPI004044015E
MKTTLLLILTLSINSLYSQSDKTEDKSSDSTQLSGMTIENKTSNTNKGGNKFYKYIADNFVPSSDENFTGGKVIVEFVVKTDGSVSVTQIINDLGFGTNEKLIEVFEKSPKWKPGIKDGKPVEVKFSMPLNIQGRKN